MVKGFVLPSPILRNYIDRYWYWESERDEIITLPKIYPGTGTELFFHYNSPFKGFSNSHYICPREKDSYILNQDGQIGFIAVRFKSSSFNIFTSIPIDVLKNKTVSIFDIWGNRGEILEESIQLADGIDKRVDILNCFFENILNSNRIYNRGINWAINYIYYNYNNLTIKDVISKSDLSSRTFQRKFKESTGVSAKEFHKISRFQSLLKVFLLDNRSPNLNLVLDSGYYDQAHFNKDFKQLSGDSPTKLLKSRNLAHFYNKSL